MHQIIYNLQDRGKRMIKKQIKEFLITQPNMHVVEENNSNFSLQGIYHFSGIWDEISYEKDYKLKIEITEDFPLSMPKVFCCDNYFDGYSHLNPDKSFCLGVLIDNYLKMQHSPTILNFFKLLVDPYIYSFEYCKEFGFMPFGEREHGLEGVWEFYKEYFCEPDTEKCARLFVYVVKNDSYRGHHLCPCGSGIKTRKCHGNVLNKIFKQKTDRAYAMLLTKDMEDFIKNVKRSK